MSSPTTSRAAAPNIEASTRNGGPHEDSDQFEAPIDRDWDHLESIRSTLVDLRGSGSLAQELIQNADDAKGAKELTFRFTDEALVVEDDGGFRACRNLRAPICELQK